MRLEPAICNEVGHGSDLSFAHGQQLPSLVVARQLGTKREMAYHGEMEMLLMLVPELC